MRARTLVIVVLVVAVIVFLAYSFVSRTDVEDTTAAAPSATTSMPASTAPSATTSMPASTAPEVPADFEPTKSPTEARAAEEIARQGLTVAFTWYPATDTTQNDAYGRAQEWLTDKLAARMIIEARTERGPSVQWDKWAQQQAKVIADVSVECSGCPQDTDTTIQRVATIKQTAIADGSTATVKPDTTVWVTLVKEGDRWLIDDIRY
jgi:hypothetical protein